MYSHDWRAVSCIMFKNAVPHVFWPYRIPWVVRYRLVHFRAPASHISLHLYSPWELFTSIETLAIQRTEQHWASRLDWPQIRGNMIPPSWVSVRLQAITGKFQPFSPGTQPLKRIHRWDIRAGPHLWWLKNIFEHLSLSLVCQLTFYTLNLRTFQTSLLFGVAVLFYPLVCCSFKLATNKFIYKELSF